MKIRVVFTDLDGTLLEPDGSLRDEAAAAVRRLTSEAVPVCAVTSKTAEEIAAILAVLGLATPAGFENGAGALLPDRTVVLDPAAVAVDVLRAEAARLRTATGAPLRTLDELDDGELAAITALPAESLAGVRRRRATLPLVVAPEWDDTLRRALPARPRLRLLRGNRFLHLQGGHDKTSVLELLLAHLPARPGAVVACGDSPNDVELLAGADIPVIVPSAAGPSPELARRFPGAVVAPAPHGRGWAAAMDAIFERTSP